MIAPTGVRTRHTFVVPAFGEPAWLERCVVSLLGQTLPSPVVIATSTPNSHITSVAERTGVPVVNNVNDDRDGGIARDWNFALAQAVTPWVTLAHQDDWYEPDYTEACLVAAGQVERPVIVFTDTTETMEGSDATLMNTRVKRAISGSVFGPSRSIASLWR